MDILLNPSTLAILGIVIPIIVALLIYRLQKQKKSLAYRILTKTELLSVKEEIQKDVEILYRGKPVKQVQLIILKLICLGNIPIEYDDIKTPISISFEKETQILSAEILQKNPKNIETSIDLERNTVIVKPRLLNQDDALIVRILATKVGKKIAVEGRIAGVKEIKQISEITSKYKLVFSLVFTLMLLGLAIYFAWALTGRSNDTLISISYPVMIAGVIIYVIFTILDTRNTTRSKKELELLTSKSK